jgi:hypothetical protein
MITTRYYIRVEEVRTGTPQYPGEQVEAIVRFQQSVDSTYDGLKIEDVIKLVNSKAAQRAVREVKD